MTESSFDAARQARRITEQAVTWYIEQQEPLSERQRVAFLNWLRASPKHVAEYFAVARMHGDMKAAAKLQALSAADLVERAQRDNPVVMFPRIGGDQPQAHSAPPPRWRALAGATGIAAALALAWLGAAQWRANPAALPPTAAAPAVADAPGVRSMTLADGTLVRLDRDSDIRVRFDAHVRRIDVLRGHVMFDVGKDPARPMFVDVGGHVLQDIGTVFDVKRDAGSDTLTVISGRVRVLKAAVPAATTAAIASLDSEAVADLTAGQQIELSTAGAGTVHAVALARATAWLPSEIRFQHETIGDVARRFNAYTSKPLLIENDRIADQRISGVFHADNPQAFVAYLASLPNVRIIDDADRIRVIAARHSADSRAHRL